jgi:ABC-type branched-subunit amino acid transport system permease subunit
MGFLLHLAGLTLLYAAWGAAMGLIVHRLGLLCLASAAIAGTGAYAYGVAASATGIWQAWLLAVAFGAIAGAAAVGVAGRVRGHDYALATFGAMLAWESFVGSAQAITGGGFGLSGIPPLPFSDRMSAPVALVLYAGALFVAVMLGLRWEGRRRVRAAAALTARSVELASSFDIPATLLVAGYGATVGAWCGFGGAVLVGYVGFVGPTLLTVSTSVLILALALSWAEGRLQFTAVLFFIVAVPELVRFLNVQWTDPASLQVAFAGAALMLLGLTAKLGSAPE